MLIWKETPKESFRRLNFEIKIQELEASFKTLLLAMLFNLLWIALSILSWYIEYYCYSWGLHLMLTERHCLLRWKYISYLLKEWNHKYRCVFLDCPRAIIFLTYLKHLGLPKQSKAWKSRKCIRNKLLILDKSAFHFGIVFLSRCLFEEGKSGTYKNLFFCPLSFSQKCCFSISAPSRNI